MGRIARQLRRRFTGATPLAFLLAATVGLAAWQGWEAVTAALSHRRTAEAVLSDYAAIASTEMSREIDSNLGDVLEVMFQDVRGNLYSRRRDPGDLPGAREIGDGDINDAMDEVGCGNRCIGLRSPLARFRVDAARMEVDFISSELAPEVQNALVREVLAQEPPEGRVREGFLTTDAGGLLPEPVVVAYLLWAGSADVPERAAYGLVATTSAMAALIGDLYDDEELLPDAIAGELPNDSLLHVQVRSAQGPTIFASNVAYEAAPSAADTLDDFGGMVVEATIRPDAAERLIIGGLPRSRIPLLAGLLVLTFAIGTVAFVQLRREQQFQRLRDDFVSGVSHELRTPLAQIRMFAELQEAGVLRSDEDRKRAVAVIHRESRRLTHLVENILQFSRLRRTPEQGMPREALDLADGLEHGLDAVTPLLADRGMALEVEAEHGLTVVANRDALTRIVVNLLDNAVKYGPAGQTIEVRVEREGNRARLSVADEGPGVPPPERDRIWKPYRRLERDVKAQLPGTGIGLSVVHELAQLHDGKAWVEDSAGGGARFVVELPLADRGERPPDVGPGAPGAPASARPQGARHEHPAVA